MMGPRLRGYMARELAKVAECIRRDKENGHTECVKELTTIVNALRSFADELEQH